MTTDDWAAGDDGRKLPIDPDIDDTYARFPHVDPRVVLAAFLGGIVGGLARYCIGRAAPPSPSGFPWDIIAINIGGAFALAVLLVIVLELLPRAAYLRPALGTGFLGAFTTFSSLAVGADHLAAHDHAAVAAIYVTASVVGGLAATRLGLGLGRIVRGAFLGRP
jgi:CrcB protein